jgi:hypothetical protein
MTPLAAMQIARVCHQISGWFSLEAALWFAWIDEVQRRLGASGDMFEIGVHRGRSAVLLSHLLGPDESLGVCDLFGQQDENVSRSGAGNRAAFESNMRHYGVAQERLRVFAGSSSRLSPADIGRNHRFFHIDGGHNADEALSDLRLAAECTTALGAIVVDDPFRVEWPGVTEGIIRFLESRTEYAAVAVGFNKLLITKTEIAEEYGRAWDERQTRVDYGLGYPWSLKVLPFLSRPLRIFHVPSRVNPRSLRCQVERIHRWYPWSRRTVPAGVIDAMRRVLP